MAQSVQGLIAIFGKKKKWRAEYWFLMQTLLCYLGAVVQRVISIKFKNLAVKGIVLINFGSCYIKDGAYYCYCTYVVRISRYSSFLSVMLTNIVIFLRGLKLSGESRS